MAAKNTKQATHQWPQKQLDFLVESDALSGPELCKAFRSKFRKASAELTDKAIINRRYVLLHR